jgi:hypothetical protein
VAALKQLKEVRSTKGHGVQLDIDYVLVFSPANFQNAPLSVEDNQGPML